MHHWTEGMETGEGCYCTSWRESFSLLLSCLDFIFPGWPCQPAAGGLQNGTFQPRRQSLIFGFKVRKCAVIKGKLPHRDVLTRSPFSFMPDFILTHSIRRSRVICRRKWLPVSVGVFTGEGLSAVVGAAVQMEVCCQQGTFKCEPAICRKPYLPPCPLITERKRVWSVITNTYCWWLNLRVIIYGLTLIRVRVDVWGRLRGVSTTYGDCWVETLSVQLTLRCCCVQASAVVPVAAEPGSV